MLTLPRSPELQPDMRFVLLTALTVVAIVYGSLYPFDFRIPADGEGAVIALLRSWAMLPSGRGDFVANVLFYTPLGWFGVLSLPRRISVAFRFLLIVIGGTTLSVSIELAQYYDVGRVTAANDVYANLLGTIIGGLAGITLFRNWRFPPIAAISTKPIPAALLAAWAGYRLYPYVPTIDLHKYWNALKPIIFYSTLPPEALYRHTTIWLTTFVLISELVGPRPPLLLAPLFCGSILVARVLIVDTVLSVPEIAGAAIALCLWPVMLRLSHRRRAAVLFILLGAAIVIGRLQPFHFQPTPRDFGWVPFRGLLAGSIAVNVMSFCEKSFLYGSLLYLFTEAGGRLRSAVLIVGGTLFVTSFAQTYLPGRSAEITDPVMVLLLAAAFSLLRGKSSKRRMG